MSGGFGQGLKVRGIGSFVVNQVNSLDPLLELREGSGIAAIGKAPRLKRPVCKVFTTQNLRLFTVVIPPDHILPSFQSTYLLKRQVVLRDGIFNDIKQRLFFLEQVSVSLYPVTQRKCVDIQILELANQFRFMTFHSMYNYLVLRLSKLV